MRQSSMELIASMVSMKVSVTNDKGNIFIWLIQVGHLSKLSKQTFPRRQKEAVALGGRRRYEEGVAFPLWVGRCWAKVGTVGSKGEGGSGARWLARGEGGSSTWWLVMRRD